jgi:transposase
MNYQLFVGIDQSKHTVDVCVFKDGKSHHEQFENSLKGFKKMMKWITSLYKVELHEILFCSEQTGLYSLPLSIFLTEQQAHLWLENPLQIKLSVYSQSLPPLRWDSAEIRCPSHFNNCINSFKP